MNFIIDLLSTIHRNKTHDAILVIVNWYSKIVYYITCTEEINASKLEERLIKKMFLKFRFSRSIISNRELIFILKYWETLCYYLCVKRYLFTIFHLQIDNQIERDNQILECYL